MTARRCAYLTMENQEGWSIDAELGFPFMEAMGWTIDALPWRRASVNWDKFDAVYVGTPWDYPEDPQRFMRLLEAVDRSSAVLVNDLSLVSWSMSKTYLRDLQTQGVAIVPSIWGERYEPGMLHDAFGQYGADRIIVKPVISTNATNTYLIGRQDVPAVESKLAQIFNDRACVIQPFMDNIQSEGEHSLFYFNRQFSHAVRKTPKQDDYRVQEEYGAEIIPGDPEPLLRDAGDRVLQVVEPLPVYARVDFVRGREDRFLLMELELVEPSMYLRMDEAAPERFAKAFNEYFTKVSGTKSR